MIVGNAETDCFDYEAEPVCSDPALYEHFDAHIGMLIELDEPELADEPASGA